MMKICEKLYKRYDKYEDFLSDFVKDAMQYGVVSLVVNWGDALGVCQLLNTFTINGKSIAMRHEYAEESYADVVEQKESNGNILITLFSNGEIICEKALDKESAYVDDALYFVEYSAKEFTLPLHAKVVPFKIETQIFDNVF
jgi:hypothetical protein